MGKSVSKGEGGTDSSKQTDEPKFILASFNAVPQPYSPPVLSQDVGVQIFYT